MRLIRSTPLRAALRVSAVGVAAALLLALTPAPGHALSKAQREANKRARAKARAKAQAAKDRAFAERAVRTPVRLTAGDSDQFLGAIDRGERMLVYTTNRNATVQLETRPMRGGAARLLLDDGADVSFPRLSPDASRLLFISKRDDAGGDLCVVDLEGGRVKEDSRRCLTDASTSEAQAFWFPNGRHIGAVVRDGIHGDYELRRFDATGGVQKGRVIVKRNLSAPALSPDGRWLAYVPVTRGSTDVGVGFAMRAGTGIALVRLDAPDKVQNVRLALPGTSGFPAFGADGKHLYFSQYLNDTNFDGRIDGDDNAVLFRVPFRSGAASPVGTHPIEQLSSARMNCQYPVPGRTQLVMTCDVDGSLDVFSLPIDGAVPAAWTADKTQQALATATNPWDRLLLLLRLSEQTKPGSPERVGALREMSWLHLTLGEFASAAYYTALAGSEAGGDAAAAAKVGLMAALVQHRRGERQIDRGRLTTAFLRATDARIARVDALLSRAKTADARVFGRLVRAEMLDVIGREAESIRALEGVALDGVKDPIVLTAYGAVATRLQLELGRREEALAGLEKLAGHPALQERERVRYAEAWLRTLLRGADLSTRKARVAKALTRVDRETPLGMMLALEAQLLTLASRPRPEGKDADKVDEPVRAAIQEVYRLHKEAPRRKALVRRTLDAAARYESTLLLYEYTALWVSGIKQLHADRVFAERIFRAAQLEQAYVRMAAGTPNFANGAFFMVTRQAPSLEAWAGYIETRIAWKKDDAAKQLERFAKRGNGASAVHFGKAWLTLRPLFTARVLPDADTAMPLLEKAREQLKGARATRRTDVELHTLVAWIAHAEFRLTGSRDAAQEALGAYQLGLALARDNPRYRAPLLHGLGLMHAQAGNHWLAVEHFDARETLPFLSPRTHLGLLLAKSRSLFQTDDDARAAKTAEAALALVRRTPELTPWLPLALDRAALTSIAAERWEAALGHLDDLAGHVAKLPAERRGWQETKRRTARALAALGAGRFDEAARDADAALGGFDALHEPQPLLPGITRDAMRYRHVDYRAALQGFRTLALDGLGKRREALAAARERIRWLEERQEDRERTDQIPELADARLRAAVLVARVEGPAAAAPLVATARREMASFAELSGTVVHEVRLRALRATMLLHLHHGLAPGALGGPLTPEISAVHDALCERRNPRWAAERTFFTAWRAALRLRAGGG